MTPRQRSEPTYSAGSPFRARPAPVVEQFAVDDRVTHDRFGLGRVVSGNEAAVVVEFGDQRVRLVSPFAKLHKL
ncbi:hypothetical protein [Phycicoccus flavus]|uniref:hypothetical protein n=1 Tax=Phycicoccus flavus TaxID=2502783 RepID=UPI000FEBB1E1|nr:hypothetical protein [Phycicoccus flavus]NHA67219.1 hypothetical protein [Phycicoccus flavus]